jgi:hypothetical protein
MVYAWLQLLIRAFQSYDSCIIIVMNKSISKLWLWIEHSKVYDLYMNTVLNEKSI